MDLTYHSPIKFDFRAVSGSFLTFVFKLKGSKINVKIKTSLNIYYREVYNIGRISLLSSDLQIINTSIEDKIHSLKFKVPEFKNCGNLIQSYVYLVMEQVAGNPYAKVQIEDMKIGDSYSSPSAAMAIPHLQPKISVTPEQKSMEIKEWYDKVIFLSTWDIKCGIAQYTRDLLYELESIYPGHFSVRGMQSANNFGAKLVHIQHEHSIMSRPPIVGGKVIITWHTITKNITDIMKMFESAINVVAHIVPCKGALEYIHTKKDVYVIKLGSKIINPIKKEDARKFLNINVDKPVGFVFGFQSPNKNYSRLINAAKNTNLHLIISGSLHFTGFHSRISNANNVTFLGRYLTEDEIDLYASASDLLLFDYALQEHYSSSSAMHRTVGAGRPIICSNTRHFNDIDGVLKFNNQQELESNILYVLNNSDKFKELSLLSLQYARETSNEIMANMHLDIYKKYIVL